MGKQVTDSCSIKIREKKRVEYIQINPRKIRPPFASPPVSVAIIRIPEHRQAPPYRRGHRKIARNDHTKPQFLVQCATTISAIRRDFDQPPPEFYASQQPLQNPTSPLPRSRWSCRERPTNLYGSWIMIRRIPPRVGTTTASIGLCMA